MFRQDFTTRQYMITPDFEYFHYIDPSTLEVGYHNHDFYEVYFFLSGKVTYVIEGRSYRLKPGDILLVHNRDLHKPMVESGKIYERIVIWVNPDFLVKHSDGMSNLTLCFETAAKRSLNLLRPSAEMLSLLRDTLDKFEKACNSASFGSNVLKNTYMVELMVYLNKAFLEVMDKETGPDMEYNERVDSIIRYINTNLSEPLSLNDLSARFYMSKYHLLREFKRYSGYTLHRYITQKRLILARSLLKEGLTVTEACASCGFGDYSNFIRAFKKTYGVPPGKYVQENSLRP